MTLLEANTKVRRLTRHVSDTVRLTDAVLNEILNDKYIELRTELHQLAPSFALKTGPELTVPTGEELSNAGSERIVRVERKVNDIWRPVPMSDPTDPEQHQASVVSWEERGGCIILHPEGQVSSADYGLFRVLYYETPGELTDSAHVFSLPVFLDRVLVYRTCADVAFQDGDDPAGWEKRADDTLDKFKPELAARYGVHELETFREVLGY